MLFHHNKLLTINKLTKSEHFDYLRSKKIKEIYLYIFSSCTHVDMQLIYFKPF